MGISAAPFNLEDYGQAKFPFWRKKSQHIYLNMWTAQNATQQCTHTHKCTTVWVKMDKCKQTPNTEQITEYTGCNKTGLFYSGVKILDKIQSPSFILDLEEHLQWWSNKGTAEVLTTNDKSCHMLNWQHLV